MTDICGKLAGLETEPLAVGVAYTTTPDKPIEWKRIKENPVLSTEDPDVRWFEAQTLYKSNIIWDKDETLGHQFVMYYNGKQKVEWIERIGMAVSDDMIHWKRYGTEPVIDTPIGISGRPPDSAHRRCLGNVLLSARGGDRKRSTTLPAHMTLSIGQSGRAPV